jgi:hypothetical protein
MFALKRLMPAASLFAFLSLAACGDSLSPTDVDPVALEAEMTDAAETFSQHAIFQSLLNLSPHFPAYGASPAGLARITLERARGPLSPAGRAAAIGAARLFASSSTNPLALFPSNVLGKTLEWNTSTSQYAISTLAGAPANGIRILLYFADPSTGEPFLPLTLIGAVDLTDKSTPQADKLGVKLTFGQTTAAEYDITVVSGTSSASVTIAGYLQAVTGTGRIDFNLLELIGTSGNTFSLISTNDITSNGTAIRVKLTSPDIFEDLATVEARIQRGNATLELAASGALATRTGPLSGTVKFNGTAVAAIGGTFEDPAVTGSGGHGLTSEQIIALLVIFGNAIDFASDFAIGIFAPGYTVF